MTAENTLRIAPQTTDLESFIASGDRLFQKQRQKLMDDEQAYRQERFRLEDQIRDLDARYAKEQADGLRMLNALAALREG